MKWLVPYFYCHYSIIIICIMINNNRCIYIFISFNLFDLFIQPKWVLWTLWTLPLLGSHRHPVPVDVLAQLQLGPDGPRRRAAPSRHQHLPLPCLHRAHQRGRLQHVPEAGEAGHGAHYRQSIGHITAPLLEPLIPPCVGYLTIWALCVGVLLLSCNRGSVLL